MRRLAGVVGAVAFLMVVTAVPVGAGNATGLHWGDGTSDGTQFSPGLTLVDQTDGGVWTGVVATVVGVWDNGSGTADDVLDLSATTDATATTGDLCSTDWDANTETVIPNEIHVCNDNFGNTGWVGLSITWFIVATGEIVVAQTLLNDFFLQDPTSIWDDDDARQLAVCQEIGHGLGVDHQKGRNKQTCMNTFFGVGDPLFAVPNQHDFDQLAKIYSSGDDNGDGNGGPKPCNPNRPNCPNEHRDFGTLSRIIHIIPVPVPGS